MPIFRKAVTALQGVFDGANRVYSDSNPPSTLLMTEFATGSIGTIAAGTADLTTPDGAELWMKSDSQVLRLIGPTVELIPWTVQGAGGPNTVLATQTGVFEVPITGGTFTFLSLAARLATAPTGATTFKIDINKNGTSIWNTNQANRPIWTASADLATLSTPDTVTWTTGDYLSLDIDAVGSTEAGRDLVVVLRMIRTA